MFLHLLKTDDNPEGVDADVFEGIKRAITAASPGLNAEEINAELLSFLGERAMSNRESLKLPRG